MTSFPDTVTIEITRGHWDRALAACTSTGQSDYTGCCVLGQAVQDVFGLPSTQVATSYGTVLLTDDADKTPLRAPLGDVTTYVLDNQVNEVVAAFDNRNHPAIGGTIPQFPVTVIARKDTAK